jgi:hypothetical protein
MIPNVLSQSLLTWLFVEMESISDKPTISMQKMLLKEASLIEVTPLYQSVSLFDGIIG